MVDQYTLGQNYDIDLIVPDLMFEAAKVDDDPLLAALPMTFQDSDLIVYEQLENGYGLLSLRGLGGEVDVVGVPGYRRSMVAPGYYGERVVYDETEMTKGREPGTPNTPASVETRIGVIFQYQAGKSVSRIRNTLSTFLLTGKFKNVNAAGRVAHADSVENYRTFSPANDGNTGPGWAADPVNATPLKDLRYWMNQIHASGTDSNFGEGSTLLCQESVVNDLLNTNDVKGTYKSEYGSTINGPKQLNKLLTGFGLPPLTPYNHGYFPTLADAVARTNFTRHLPVKSLIWVGTRPGGQPIGKFVLTRHQGNQPAPGYASPPSSPGRSEFQWAKGLYMNTYYHNRMPFKYEVDVAFNGGPVLHFGSGAAGITYT